MRLAQRERMKACGRWLAACLIGLGVFASGAGSELMLGAGTGGRQVLLFGHVDADLARDVVDQLLELNNSGAGEIDLLINSTGGSIGDARAVISAFHLIDAPVNTVCIGYAWSSAATILAAGTGVRQAFEHTSVMIHELSWEDSGPISALEATAKQGRRDNDVEVKLLSRFTGRSPELIAADMAEDHFLNATEAKHYGLIDSVLPIPKRKR